MAINDLHVKTKEEIIRELQAKTKEEIIRECAEQSIRIAKQSKQIEEQSKQIEEQSKQIEGQNKQIAKQNKQMAELKFRMEHLIKLINGSKRERFVPNENPHQLSLFDLNDNAEQEDEDDQSCEVEVKVIKKKKKTTKSRKRNTFPANLERIVELIKPEEWEQNMQQIGVDITETLGYIPMKLFVKRIERPRFVKPNDEDSKVYQANIPPRIVPKGLLDDTFIAGLIVEKFEYHMPMYRFAKKLKPYDIPFINEDHFYYSIAKAGEALQGVHHLLLKDVLQSGYNQMDESGIRVLKKDDANSAQKGCMWALYSPKTKAVCFNYRPTKQKHNAYEILDGYTGVLQCDGNVTYEGIANAPPGMKIAGKYRIFITYFLICWAHARRKFFEAKDLAPDIIYPVLREIQKLYMIERQAREKNLSADDVYRLRQQKAVPILKSLKQKLDKAALKNLTGAVKKAFAYTIKRWPELSNYVQNGEWQIDNNLLENKFRLLALGRRNYLFAGTDKTAQHIATFYSLIGTCQMHDINTYQYFTWLLHKVNTEKITDNAVNWLPHRVDKNLFQ